MKKFKIIYSLSTGTIWTEEVEIEVEEENIEKVKKMDLIDLLDNFIYFEENKIEKYSMEEVMEYLEDEEEIQYYYLAINGGEYYVNSVINVRIEEL